MSFIEKSVARLEQQDRLEALARELGKSHYHYNAPPKYYSVRPPNTSERTAFFCDAALWRAAHARSNFSPGRASPSLAQRTDAHTDASVETHAYPLLTMETHQL